MTFAREKRLLLGASALLVAVPLPLNQALEWPVLALFLAVVALFLRRAWQGSERWLSHRALNLLGLAYLPVLVVDVAISGRIQFVRPILHLILFGLAAKLWSLEREKDKWQIWIGIFFLFLAAMSTSTHPSVIAYLVAFAALSVVILLRFVHLHVLSSFAPRAAASPPLPVGRLVAAVVVATVALAAPLFTLLPRVRTPMVTGPAGFGSQPVLPMAGFSDEMSLDLIGRIRGNSEIALRMRFEGRPPAAESLRLKASAYDVWEGRSWKQLPQGRLLDRLRGSDAVRLAEARPVATADVVLEPLRSRSLVLPMETIEVELPGRRLTLDAGGTLGLGSYPTGPVEYRAVLAQTPRSHAAPPEIGAAEGGPLDARGVGARMIALAASWAGEGSARQRAERIESRFHREFEYTTAFLGRGGEAPLETFLFETRRGHCEYFASSMVLLLRAVGVPARLVTGFYGAEWSAWEGAWVVRQSNAHAWVEAWLGDGEGWAVFDPTPPAGLPSAQPRDLRLWARQAWEAVLFRWDRWVISYDFDDQVGVLGGLRAAWDRLWARLFDGDPTEAAPPSRDAGPAAADATATEAATERDRGRLLLAALAAAAAAALGGAYLLKRRPRWDATAAYLRLRRALAGSGAAVPESLAPLALARLAARRLPDAAAPAERVVAGYLAEAYAGRPLTPDLLAALRADVEAVESAARRQRSRRRPPAPAARRAA